MTRAQKKWLQRLNEEGFVSWGSWGDGQRNRPLRKLVNLGLAKPCIGPRGSFLKVEGVEPVDA